MNKSLKLVFTLFSVMCIGLLCSSNAQAQYRGYYQQNAPEEKNKDPAAPPVPKIFSSQVTSKQQAEKLDRLYNNLYISLWNYALIDFNHQKKLYDLIDFKRFQVTRYTGEFKDDLQDAMEDLNTNSKKMLADIDKANEEYKDVKIGIRKSDYEVLDKLWEEKIEQYRKEAKLHFKMQHSFLKTYYSLVGYIIKQGGSYYYDSQKKAVSFYKHGGYQFFGKSLDKLRKITHEQKKTLRTNTPANINPALMQ